MSAHERLIHGGNIYVRPYELRFTTMDVDADGALACVSAQIHNDSLDAKTLTVSVTVKDADRNIAAANSYPVRINSRSVLNFRKNVYMEQAQVWDEYNPNLYTITLTIADGECVLDTTTISSGIRRLSLDSRHGLRVNGKIVKLRGACLHHDQGILDAATYYDYECRRVKRLKEAGFSAVRSAHNPSSYGISRNFGPWRFTDCTFCYSYEGQEGRPIMIQVYAGGDAVELLSTENLLADSPAEKIQNLRLSLIRYMGRAN